MIAIYELSFLFALARVSYFAYISMSPLWMRAYMITKVSCTYVMRAHNGYYHPRCIRCWVTTHEWTVWHHVEYLLCSTGALRLPQCSRSTLLLDWPWATGSVSFLSRKEGNGTCIGAALPKVYHSFSAFVSSLQAASRPSVVVSPFLAVVNDTLFCAMTSSQLTPVLLLLIWWRTLLAVLPSRSHPTSKWWWFHLSLAGCILVFVSLPDLSYVSCSTNAKTGAVYRGRHHREMPIPF